MYVGYVKSVQRYYEREPILQASLQLVLSIFTVAFFIFLAVRPTLRTITTLLRKIEDQQRVSEQLGRKMGQLAQAQENLALYGEEIEAILLKAIPEGPQVDKLARQLEAISLESGAYITSLDVQGSPLVGDKKSIVESSTQQQVNQDLFVTFSFVVGGTQEQIRNFVNGVENMERAVLLAKVTISKPEQLSQSQFSLTANGRATIYYLKNN